jgi:hypothetical protein
MLVWLNEHCLFAQRVRDQHSTPSETLMSIDISPDGSSRSDTESEVSTKECPISPVLSSLDYRENTPCYSLSGSENRFFLLEDTDKGTPSTPAPPAQTKEAAALAFQTFLNEDVSVNIRELSELYHKVRVPISRTSEMAFAH